MNSVIFGPYGPANSASGMAQKIVSFPEPLQASLPAGHDQARLNESAVILRFPARPPVVKQRPKPKSRWDAARDLIDRIEARSRAAAGLRRERAIRRAIERSKGTETHR